MTLEADEKVIAAIKSDESDNLIRLSTGVVLKGHPANSTTLIAVIASFPRPKPPIYHNDRMGRDMENPDDPDYISRVQAWQVEQGDALLTAFILLGTELVSKPKGMIGPNPEFQKTGKKRKRKSNSEKIECPACGTWTSELTCPKCGYSIGDGEVIEELVKKDWLDKFALLNLPMKPEDDDWRYLMWVKTVACQPVSDTKLIQEVVGRLSGVSKSDVQAAEEFPGRS